LIVHAGGVRELEDVVRTDRDGRAP